MFRLDCGCVVGLPGKWFRDDSRCPVSAFIALFRSIWVMNLKTIALVANHAEGFAILLERFSAIRAKRNRFPRFHAFMRGKNKTHQDPITTLAPIEEIIASGILPGARNMEEDIYPRAAVLEPCDLHSCGSPGFQRAKGEVARPRSGICCGQEKLLACTIHRFRPPDRALVLRPRFV